MLNLLEVRTDQGTMLSLPLEDLSSGYLIKDIQGLDPVAASIVYSSMAAQDDEQEQSTKREKRNIQLKLGYEPNYVDSSIRTLRDKLYGFFMPKTQVRLRFYFDDMPPVEIVGRVEVMDAPLFARDPEVNISIMCAKSNFYGLDTLTVGSNTVTDTTELTVHYDGTIETGGRFRLLPNRNMSGFSIYNRISDDVVLQQDFAYALVNNDILDINSVPLSKYARLTRGGGTNSVLFGISPTSRWINLYPGVNRLRVVASGAPVPWTFQYVNKYGGL